MLSHVILQEGNIHIQKQRFHTAEEMIQTAYLYNILLSF